MSTTKRVTTADIPIDRIRAATDNPRTHLDGIEELAASIKELGQLVPIVVERRSDGAYDLLAGHRRCAALKLLGRSARAEIRTGKKLDDGGRLALMVAENAQRRALDPIDEANAYRRLVRDRGITQFEVARLVGTSDFTVSRRLELLRLTQVDQQRVREGKLSLGAAHKLLNPGKKTAKPRGLYATPPPADADGIAGEAQTITFAVTDKEWAEMQRRCKARNYTPEAFARAAFQQALRS